MPFITIYYHLGSSLIYYWKSDVAVDSYIAFLVTNGSQKFIFIATYSI